MSHRAERAIPMATLNDELAIAVQLNAREASALAAAGIHTVRQLLDHLPRRHEDRRRFDAFPIQASLSPMCLRGKVTDTMKRRFSRGGLFEAVITDAAGGVFGSGNITCRWFHMPFLHKLIAAGQQIVLYGKVKEHHGRCFIDHPEFEILDDADADRASIHLESIVPVYRNISGISQRRLRELIHRVIGDLLEDRDAPSAEMFGAPASRRLYHDAHFPESIEAAAHARREFALTEFTRIQLNALWRRERHRSVPGRSLGKRTRLLTEWYRSLPFDLTSSQKQAIHEIVAELRRPHAMNRLLQGDVGSGKTFVAMAAMLLAVESGCQAALMAPTQILAEQHHQTFSRWLEPLGLRIVLCTGARAETSERDPGPAAQLLIGTHALIHRASHFDDLGLVVIDEQHKFGVEQRAALVRHGHMPDVLVMSATPIPRTLVMTVYGDLDVSVLRDKPPGRIEVTTSVMLGGSDRTLAAKVRSHLDQGRQAYLVYPLIGEDGRDASRSAVDAAADWNRRLVGYEVGLLHGKLKPEEKEDVMRRFRDGMIHALVSTSVIEVGVDVPNATLMVIHHAERFGLAQLHQLRGRIGRGGNAGECLLLAADEASDSFAKLRVLENTSDGFQIAEEDLRLRGPGDVLGTMQSGTSGLRFAEFLADADLLVEARRRAEIILREDPHLDGKHQACKAWLNDSAEVILP
jgi:ATP-dependent DNA helicase RecG